MSTMVRRRPGCIRCGAALFISEGARTVQCRYCGEIMEVTEFAQEESRLTAAIEKMNRSLNEAEQRLEDAMDEFARTGSAAAGLIQRQAEEQYESLREKLENLRGEYENSQARKLSGWFTQGENAQHMRRYDEALGHYQRVLAMQSEEAEVHWRMLMCLYGIEYVRDQRSGNYLPTLTRMQVEDLLQEAAYLDACRFARDERILAFYREEGQRLDRIVRKYQYICGSEAPYDVFISVKQGDDEGKMTPDAQVGLSLYHTLSQQGMRVFNSAESLKNKAGEEYEPYIMHALSTSSLMVVVASCEEYLSARWLKNEWRRFRWLREQEGVQSTRRLIVYSIKQGELLSVPPEIGAIQLIDAQVNAEPVAQLCRIARDMFSKGVPVEEAAKKTAEPTVEIPEQGVEEYQEGLRFLYGQDAQADKKKAFVCFERAAKGGHAQAMYELGRMYLTGIGTKENACEAAKWFEAGAQKGCAAAQYEYAYCCDKGIGTEADMDAAFVWYDKALTQFKRIAESDGEAMYYLGRSLLAGEGSSVDEAQAVVWLRKASVEGVCAAQFLLGRCYEDGRGIARNEAQAVKNFQKASAQGHAEARARLERIENAKRHAEEEARQKAEQERLRAEQKRLEEERTRREAEERERRLAEQERLRTEQARREAATPLNMQTLIDLIEEKIRQTEEEEKRQALLACVISLVDGLRRRRQREAAVMSAEAMYQRAEDFYKGKGGTPKNLTMAAQWYRKAADRGHAAAQNALGWCYDSGKGVTQDRAKAAYWYEQSALQGYVKAQNNIALCYANGEGVTQNHVRAVQWYKKAAEAGYAESQHNLGGCFYRGEGVPQDYAEALKWYKTAAQQGHTKAQYNLGLCHLLGKGTVASNSQAEFWFSKAAAQGHSVAAIQLELVRKELLKEKNRTLSKRNPSEMTADEMNAAGDDYYHGRGVQKNFEQAVYWYRLAAERGSKLAQYNLGVCYEKGQGVTADRMQAAQWYRKAAEQGYTLAMRMLGDLYYYGNGVQKDYRMALGWYEKAASNGNALAKEQIARCQSALKKEVPLPKKETVMTGTQMWERGNEYASGRGVPKNYETALSWYLRAAEAGHIIAQRNAGDCYFEGKGTERNYAKAFDLYRKAACKGDAKAQYSMGLCCERGLGITKNLPEAVKWYEKAALQNHAEAQYCLGKCHAIGQGTAKDSAKAFAWYEKAAEQGNAEAQYNIGVYYSIGTCVARSDVKAFEWYQKAAEQGHYIAQHLLGECYEKGSGTAKNRAKAIEWYTKAAAQGHDDAQKALKRLKGGFFSKFFS